jgi:hypothetical protein
VLTVEICQFNRTLGFTGGWRGGGGKAGFSTAFTLFRSCPEEPNLKSNHNWGQR